MDEFDILHEDPFDLLRGEKEDDPFESLRSGKKDDPFASLRSGGEGSTPVTMEPFGESQSFLREAAGNVIPNIKDIIAGGSKLVASGVKTGIDATVRLPFNLLTRDEEDVAEITGGLKKIPGAITEVAESEWERIKSLYGPVLTDLDFKPLAEEARERPVDILLDIGGIAEVAGAPFRVAGGLARGAASRTVRGATAGRAAERAVDALLETGDAGRAARAGVAADINKNMAAGLTLQQRAAEARKLELILGPAQDLMNGATVLDKTGSLLEHANPFRLAYETIGAFPGINRLRDRWAEIDEAKGRVARLRREVDRFKSNVAGEFEEGILATYSKLSPEDKKVALSHVLELNPEGALTPEIEAAVSSLKQIPRRFRSDLAKMGFDRGKQMRLVQAQAISAETFVRPGKAGKITLEEARKIVARSTGEIDDELRLFNRKINKAINEKDLDSFAKLVPERDILMEKKQLKLQAEDAWNAGDIEFVPGATTAERLADIDESLSRSLFEGRGEPIERLANPSTAHLSRKKTVDSDPMTVESRFLEYADAMTSLIGRQAMRADVKDLVVSIDQSALNDVLRKGAASYLNKKGDKFKVVDVDGELMGLPSGVAKIYEDVIGRKSKMPGGLESGLKFLDFTRGEFAKVVLGLNPGWLVYNVLGNSALYGLGAGSPRAFAQAFGMRMSKSLEGFLTKHEWSVPHMVERMAKDFRELVPQTEAVGFARYELGRARFPEFHSRAENVWGKWSIAKAGEKYGDLTEKVVNKIGIGSLNEFVEEVYRSAMWLTQAKRELRATAFKRTGQLSRALDSEQMRQGLQRLAHELDPEQVRTMKPRKLSKEAQQAMDTANMFLNDYYKLGPIERQVFRRLFPFYSWMKFANRLAVELPMKHPLRLSIAAHTSNAMNDAFTFDDGEHIPDWIKHMVPAGRNPDGTQKFKSGSGGNPFAGIIFGDEGIRGTAAGLNPVLLVPIQWLAGFSMFRGGPLRVSASRRREGLIQPFGTGRTFEVTANGVEETTPRPGPLMALARGGLLPIPGFREAEQIIRGGVHDDVGSLPELAMELGRIVAGHPRLRFLPQDQIAKLVGGKGRTFPGVFQTKEGEPIGSNEEVANRFLTAFGLRTSTIDVQELEENERARKEAARKSMLRALAEGR